MKRFSTFAGMIGIMGAMPEEIDGLVACMEQVQQHRAGMRTYYKGRLFGREAVVVFSRWGKVAAATTALHLIHQYNVEQLLFTGVAGAIHDQLHIGDVVVARHLYQHDMDARPLMQRFEIPLLGRTFFESAEGHRAQAHTRIEELLQHGLLTAHIPAKDLAEFGIKTPAVWLGDVASGDKFFSHSSHKEELLAQLPGILCVEMEGAAVAQVCHEYEVPCTVIRVISDVADDNSHIDFPRFIKNIASKYAVAIVEGLLVDK